MNKNDSKQNTGQELEIFLFHQAGVLHDSKIKNKNAQQQKTDNKIATITKVYLSSGGESKRNNFVLFASLRLMLLKSLEESKGLDIPPKIPLAGVNLNIDKKKKNYLIILLS